MIPPYSQQIQFLEDFPIFENIDELESGLKRWDWQPAQKLLARMYGIETGISNPHRFWEALTNMPVRGQYNV